MRRSHDGAKGQEEEEEEEQMLEKRRIRLLTGQHQDGSRLRGKLLLRKMMSIALQR